MRLLVGCVVALGFASTAMMAGAGPAVKLSCVYAPGDTALVTRSITTDMNRVTREDGLVVESSRETVTHRYVFLQTVVSVWPSGRPQTVRRAFRVAEVIRRVPGHVTRTETQSLVGKTITISNRTGVTTAEIPPGLDREDTESLNQALNDDFERMVLTGERVVGDTWDAPLRVDLVIMIHASCVGTIRFDRMTQFDGERCALVTMWTRVSGTSDSGAEVTTEGPSSAIWSPRLRRALAGATSGSLTVHSTTMRGATLVDVTSQGQLRVDRRLHWMRVDGKPVKRS